MSSLGRVVDVSASGFRIEGRGRIPVETGQVLWVNLMGLFGELKVKSRVVWVERTSLWRYAAGLAFEDLDDATRMTIGDVARASARALSARKQAKGLA